MISRSPFVEDRRIKKNVDFRRMAVEAARTAYENRAEDVVVLDLTGIAQFCDYFIICSGVSKRQIQGIAKAVEKHLRQSDVSQLGHEGWDEANWILLDFGGLLVHLFMPDTRQYYDFDLLWGDAKKVEWSDKEQPEKERDIPDLLR